MLHVLSHSYVRFEVFTVVKIRVVVLWVVMLYSDMVGYQCFRGSWCLHLHGEA